MPYSIWYINLEAISNIVNDLYYYSGKSFVCQLSTVIFLTYITLFPEVIRSFMSFKNQTLGQPACVQVALLKTTALFFGISVTSLINMVALLLQTGLFTPTPYFHLLEFSQENNLLKAFQDQR